ncbi:MAG: ATP-binding protein [bacterium]|nr:ATP-binding protein [bacterium]
MQHTIEKLLQESRSFNKNDVLVHADPSKVFVFESDIIEPFAPGELSWKLIKEAQRNLKESGVNTLCLAEKFMIHGEHSLRSPLFLTPLTYTIDKVRSQVRVEPVTDSRFINPYVEYILQKNDVTAVPNLSNLEEILVSAGFTLDDEAPACIGNFHHHRYAILRELEDLLEADQFSLPLASILEDGHQPLEPLNLPTDLLLPADVDHLAVFQEANEQSTVIQGPPGTGKSQVLTNILGKVLAAQKSSIVLSEKRVALEVLLQKLAEFGLDRLGFIVTSDNASRDLLKQLEANWHYFEQSSFESSFNLKLSEQYTSQLQFSLDLLNQPKAIGGISLYEFREWMHGLKTEGVPFVSSAPDVTVLKEQKAVLHQIFEKGIHRSVSAFRSNTFERDNFSSIIETLQLWYSELKQLCSVVPFSTWADLRYVTKQAILCQNRENHKQSHYADLFRENSRNQKRFFKIYKEWHRVIKELEEYPSKFVWKQEPVSSEIAHLQELHAPLERAKEKRRKRRSFLTKRKFERQWKKYSDLPAHMAHDALADMERKRELQWKKSHIIVDFCELGILKPESEVEIIHHSIQSFLQNEWEIIEDLNAKQSSYLTDSHELLSESSSQLNRLLALEDGTEILVLLEQIIVDFSEINALQNVLKTLDDDTLRLLKLSSNYKECESIVATSHWSEFRKRFPSFSEFEMSDLHEKTAAILRAQSTESKQFSEQILQSVQKSFVVYQELLNTPARKLSNEEKELKKRLRKGKSILVKEFAKTRSHPTVRELFASEAREWIQLLVPIWFSNPTQISKAFPLDRDLFDVAIFDEASQIPVQNGLGALQRAKHGIIAGDSQQMGPTSYFKSGQTEVVDLLHQASFHWSSKMLKHHYRSLHPELISFSNQHFYDGELTAYPAFEISTPIRPHFICDATFENRKNKVEAKAVAQAIESAIQSKESLGVVAFSEEQLTCIKKQLSADALLLLNERVEEGSAFLKSLENVQGDECDHLIISFGYAKDKEGNFAMRFGPMNTENGRRRLNVLLTRARKQLDFYASVTHADFKLSDNESIDLLRLWFAKLASLEESPAEIRLPFQADYVINKNVLTLTKPQAYFQRAEEMVTFQSVMESRGWNIRYQ